MKYCIVCVSKSLWWNQEIAFNTYLLNQYLFAMTFQGRGRGG
jgi:hypothetical protein